MSSMQVKAVFCFLSGRATTSVIHSPHTPLDICSDKTPNLSTRAIIIKHYQGGPATKVWHIVTLTKGATHLIKVVAQ